MEELWRRLRILFGRRRFDRDLEEEMQFHLDLQAEENRDAGMDPAEARHAARRRFGNLPLLKERGREEWGWAWLDRFAQDTRFALRTLRSNPGFTLVALAVLALGIGANTAIFSAVNALLLNPFRFPEPDRLVAVEARHVSGKNSGAGYRDFLDWREQNVVFEEMAIVPWTGTYTLTGRGEPQRITGGFTTTGLFPALGVQPSLGRFFTAEEDRPGGARVVVLSDSAWRGRFGGSAAILGNTITLDDVPYTIIGVMPARFAFPGIRSCEFWAPLRESPSAGRFQHQYSVIARLKPGIPIERAQADIAAIARRLEREFPKTNKGWGVVVTPVRDALAAEVRRPVLVLAAAVLFVLLVSCANVAGLLLARASGRAKEIAIRASLGAGRGRLVRQMLTESVILALAGGALGLLAARWLMNVLRSAAPADFGLDAVLRLKPEVLAFALALSLLTGVVFGLAPAWHGSKTDLNSVIKGGVAAWSGARSRSRFLSSLVAGEVALSLVLLTGAALLIKDLAYVLRLDTGVRADHVLTFALDLPAARYPDPPRTTSFYRELLARLRGSPGVEAAAAVATLPMTGGYSGGEIQIEGRASAADWVDSMAQGNEATPDYFRTMGIPLLRGRDFDERDTYQAAPVVIITDALARRYFPGDDPIGHRIRYQRGVWRTVVGVAASVKHQKPMQAPVPMIYFPHAQLPGSNMWVTLRGTGDPVKLAGTVREAVRALDKDIPVLRLRTMRQVVSDSVSEPRLMTSFLTGFAAFALVLAAIGIYGLIAYSVTQRTHEMGVRLALGATRGSVLALMVRKGAVLAAAGIEAGVSAALAVSRLIGSMLFGVSPRDPAVFAGIPAILFLVALAASYVPARRAARVDPASALRAE